MSKFYTLLLSTLVVFTTSSQAQNWKVVTVPTEDVIIGMEFVHPDTGFIVTTEGEVGWTYDRGGTWTFSRVAHEIDPQDVSFANGRIGVVCGRAGLIYHSADGGQTWTDVSLDDTTVSFISAQMLTPKIGLVVGMSTEKESLYKGMAFRTTDGGATWSQVDVAGMGFAELFYEPSVGVYFPAFGLLNHSIDRGKTWQTDKSTESGQARTVSFHGDVGVLAGPGGICATSNDGGLTWVDRKQDPQLNFLAAAVVDDTTIYVGGTNATMVRTVDGGTKWTRELLARSFSVYDMQVVGDRLYAAGSDGGMVYRVVK